MACILKEWIARMAIKFIMQEVNRRQEIIVPEETSHYSNGQQILNLDLPGMGRTMGTAPCNQIYLKNLHNYFTKTFICL